MAAMQWRSHRDAILRTASIVVVAMLTTTAAVRADETRIMLLDDFETSVRWNSSAGDRAPKPTGTVKLVETEAYRGRRCGSFTFDVRCDNGYVAGSFTVPIPPKITAFRFWAKTAGQVEFTVRVQDETGQTHQKPVPLEPGKWQRIELSLAEPWPLHYGGANDGKFHGDARGIQFLRGSGSQPKVGTVYIDDLAAVTIATADELIAHYWKHQEVTFKTAAPGNLFYPADEVVGTVQVNEPPEGLDLIRVTGRIFDVRGEHTGDLEPADLRRDDDFEAPVRIPGAMGFYRVELALSDGKHEGKAETRYAVIPPNPALDRRDPDSPFGVNTHFSQWWPAEVAAIVKRAGIAWIRDGFEEPGHQQLSEAPARDNHLCWLVVFGPWWDVDIPESQLAKLPQDAGLVRIARKLRAGPDANGQWDFTEQVEWAARWAELHGEYADAYDIVNEPHGPWGHVLGGSWQGGPWVEAFAELGTQVAEAIRRHDPDAILMLEEPGTLPLYRQYYEHGVRDQIDVMSPHPYNLHRSNPYPETYPMAKQIPAFRRFVREHNLPWRIWSGEVGFASFTLTDKSPPHHVPYDEHGQARMLVRMMVFQLFHGVDKIFWYDFMNDGWDEWEVEHNMGLIRTDHLPKPAVVAYANLISRLRYARWLGAYDIGAGGFAYAYVYQNADRPTIVAWTLTGSVNEAIPIDVDDVKELTITDIYGVSRTLPVEQTKSGRRAVLPLTDSPIYVDGLRAEDVEPLLTPRP